MPYRYFPIEFSSYEDYVKYLKEKGLAIEVTEGNNPYIIKTKVMTKEDKELIRKFCEDNLHTHTDWTGTYVETIYKCDGVGDMGWIYPEVPCKITN